MHGGLGRSAIRFSTVLLALVSMMSAAQGASASDGLSETNGCLIQAGSANPQKEGDTQVVTPSLAMKIAAPGFASEKEGSGAGTSSAGQSSSLPLTPHKKFNYFARSSFLSPTPYALSIASGVFGEATDKDFHRHMSTGDFLADSMTHAARSFAFRATANFFEKFAYASVFKQDPRYFRSDKKGIARIGYALSRVLVTRSDGGKDQFNVSFLAGGLTAAGVSNVWVRADDRTVSSTMGRFGTHLGYKALSNVIRELFGRR